MAPKEELGDRLAAPRSGVAGEVVHVHADELVGQLPGEPAAESPRVVERFLPVREGVFDGATKKIRHLAATLLPQVLPDHVDAERQREPRLAAPPFPEVEHPMEPRAGVSELAFVNEEPRIDGPCEDLLGNPVEWDDAVLKIS